MRAITLVSLFILLSGCLSKTPSMTPKESLGQKLFFEPRLSVDGTVSCNSCHNVMNAGVDSKQFSMGVKGALGGRNSPTVFNAKFLTVQFWDGRAKDLADQAKGPLTNPIEMGNTDHDQVMKRVKMIPGYVKEFESVYGADSVNIDNLADAIAAYEATLITLNSSYDKKTMSAGQKKGFETFKSIGCTSCHSGDHFAGTGTTIGAGFYQKFPLMPNTAYNAKYKFTDDQGRFEATKKEQDKHMFRVPTLRNIALTAPYFHNGAVKTLDEAVRVMGQTQLGLELTDEQASSLVDFLNALTGEVPEQKMPILPPTANTSVAEGF